MTDLLPLFLLAPVLAAVAYFDLRYMRIPNALVLMALLLFLASAPFLALPEIGIRLAVAALVLVIGFALFAAGLFGGGDAKMMAALMLFVPSGSYTLFAYGFSMAMMAGIGLVLMLRCVPVLTRSSWVSLRQKGTFPMGISIAMTGLMHPLAVASLG
jgi:prepilin peptidase CpaA